VHTEEKDNGKGGQDTDQNANAKLPRGGKYLTFSLAREEYAIAILKVHEIIGMMSITPIPGTPEYIRGVINLRGSVKPVIDLRLKFGMQPQEATNETCIIVVQAQNVQTGIIVDRVNDVVDIHDDEIAETPSFGAVVNTEFIMGISKAAGQVTLLLDIDKVLSPQECHELSSIAA